MSDGGRQPPPLTVRCCIGLAWGMSLLVRDRSVHAQEWFPALGVLANIA